MSGKYRGSYTAEINTAGMTDDQLADMIEDGADVAIPDSEQRERIIAILRARGHTVNAPSAGEARST